MPWVNHVYLYAFNEVYRVVIKRFLQGDDITIRNMIRVARLMKDQCPDITVIYAVDSRKGLRDEFMESVKSFDFTKQVEFADTVRREGIQLTV